MPVSVGAEDVKNSMHVNSYYNMDWKEQLCAILDKGNMPLLNKLVENVIRPFTLDRKNWLFCDTSKGAEASAIGYSIVESSKVNGIEPFVYSANIFEYATFGSPSHDVIESLMLWADDMQQECLLLKGKPLSKSESILSSQHVTVSATHCQQFLPSLLHQLRIS